jgi:hypothetical protein
MTEGDIAAQGALNAGMLGSPYGPNPLAAQAMSQADYQRMQAAQLGAASNAYPGQALTISSQGLRNHITGAAGFRPAPRLLVEVDKVANGFVFKCGSEILIAKDLEELQGHFTAQVASMLLEDK